MPSNKKNANTIVPIQHWRTSASIPVYLVQRPEIPIVTIHILFRAGSCRDAKKWGLSYLTNRMLNQGTTLHNADQIADQFSDVGAHFDISSSKDSGNLTLSSLTEKKYFDPAFKLFLEILATSNFPEEALLRRKNQILNALERDEQTPDRVAQKTFYAHLYREHPYAYPVDGTKETILSLKRDEVVSFYKQYYVSDNATLIIVGDMKRRAVEDIVNQISGHLPKNSSIEGIADIQPAQPLMAPVPLSIPFPSEQANIWMGHLGVDYHDPDHYALQIGNDILGAGGITSRLFTQVRGEHGLVYGIGSAFRFMDAIGPFFIHFATKNGTIKKALALTKKIVQDYLRKGPTSKEFSLAKQKINNEFPLSLGANADILSHLVQIGFYKLPLDYLDTYQARIVAVTLDEVKAAIKRHIHPEKMLEVVVGRRSP